MTARGSSSFLNREMSWLEFNSRVLDEAQDPRNPILERLRFYSIFHSNLDEFFMVRVASLVRCVQEGDNKPDPSGLTPYRQLESVLGRVRALEEISSKLYSEILVPALARESLYILAPSEIRPAQQKYLDDYFVNEIFPVLTPIAIREGETHFRLAGLAVHMAVLLESLTQSDGGLRLAFVQVPGRLPGLCRLPEAEKFELCWLSDVIRPRLADLFSGYRIHEAALFRITRDAEVELDDEGRYDYVRKLESELQQRQNAKPIRLEYEDTISPELLGRIETFLGEKEFASPVKRPLDPRPLFSLVDMPGFDKQRFPQHPPVLRSVFEQDRGIFDIIGEGDILLHYPYDSFDPVVEFVQRAAEDPDVLAIKQVLYRTSGTGSPIPNALIRAARNGKQVTVLVELTARFDEERNISWARDLENAGAHVLYGIAGLKVHAKIALVVRREAAGIRRYVHLGTGNYNERTARVYTDFGLFTAADDFGRDASAFFNAITGFSEAPSFSRLIMAPLGLREKFIALIRREADWARSGQISGILAKMNSLVDPTIIEELYAASAAGVPIQLNVRGICCLRPGLPKISENIRVVSIVGRYLEHGRAFVFHNGGNIEVFLSSADWMPRNLDRRVELMFPVVQEGPQKEVMDALNAQFADNQKARLLKHDGAYERLPETGSKAFSAQEYLYQSRLEEVERVRSIAPIRLVPIQREE
jgi:polyphosphate kinase